MESVQELINSILWDRRLVVLPDGRIVIILTPTVTDRNFASFYKQIVLKQAIDAGTPTEESLLKDAREGGGWTDEDDLVLKESENYIALLRSEKDKHKMFTKKQRLETQIQEAIEKFDRVKEKKYYLSILTAEYIANEAFILDMMRRTVRNIDDSPFFKESDCISKLKDDDPSLITFLAKEIVTEGAMTTENIRRVARSVEWRMLWTLNKENLTGLFNIAIANLSLNQRMLIYWSRVYDLAYESTEKPDEDIIQDDAKFDLWLQNRGKDKDEAEQAIARGIPDHHEKGVVLDGYYIDKCTCGVGNTKSLGHGERPRHANTCMFGVFKKYTREEKDKIADQIYGRNSKKIQQLQRQEQITVANVGLVDEKDLRKKKSRLILGSKEEIHKVKI